MKAHDFQFFFDAGEVQSTIPGHHELVVPFELIELQG
jgi:hypothetical protein